MIMSDPLPNTVGSRQPPRPAPPCITMTAGQWYAFVAVLRQLHPGNTSSAPQRSHTSHTAPPLSLVARLADCYLHLVWHPHGDVPTLYACWTLELVPRRKLRGLCECCLIFASLLVVVVVTPC